MGKWKYRNYITNGVVIIGRDRSLLSINCTILSTYAFTLFSMKGEFITRVNHVTAFSKLLVSYRLIQASIFFSARS